MCFLFLNDTATTEFYTYGHTLSLHDALPIYRRLDIALRRPSPDQRHDGREQHERSRVNRLEPADRELPAAKHRAIDQILGKEVERSEEHTSELQSLMPFSYAAFCL